MQLIFERGDRERPAGHALIYFQADSDIFATYVSVPAIAFDMTEYLPPFMAGALGGMDLGSASVATPIPPIPKEVPGLDFLQTLAEHRRDDLVFAGATMRNPMQMAQDAVQAAATYGELYNASGIPQPEDVVSPDVPSRPEQERIAGLSEGERLNELTVLIGRIRDALRNGSPDADVAGQIDVLAESLPAKYRGHELLSAAMTPGEQGQRLAELYLERSYKLCNEEYLELERIDHEIDSLRE